MAVAALMGVGTAVKGEEVPSLDLNFDGQLSSFTRATTSPTAPKANGDELATEIVTQDKTDTVQSKYMGPNGRLVNGYVTNHISHSTDFSTSYYTHVNSPSLTAGQADPFGGTSATTINDGNSGGFAQVRFTSYSSSVTTACFSLFVRKELTATHNSMLRFWFGTNEYYDHFFNAASGATYTVENGTNATGNDDHFPTGTIEDLGDWWRVSISVVTTNTLAPDVFIYPAASTGSFPSGYNSNTTGAITVFGAQFETTATPSQFVPTSGATASAQVARVEYDASGNPLGLLVEEARTNLMHSTNNVAGTGAGYTISSPGFTVTDNYGTAPDGTGSETTRLEYAGGAFKQVRLDISGLTLTSGDVYTASLYFKAVGSSSPNAFRLNIQEGSGGAQTTSVNFDATSEWQRATLTHTVAVTTTSGSGALWFRIQQAANSEPTDIEVWGAQLEKGEAATSYIPNTAISGTVARTADEISLATSNFGYLSSTGTSAIDVTVASKTEGNSYPIIFQFIGATDNDRIFLRSNQAGAGGGIVDTQHRDGGTATNTSVLSAPLIWPYSLNFAMAHEGTELRKALDGTLQSQATLSTALSSAHNTLSLGISPTYSVRALNGHIRRFRYFPRAINDAQLSKFTNQ